MIGGGVAANSRLRALAEQRAAKYGIRVRVPRPKLCTDNGAMVAALGSHLVAAGRRAEPTGPAGRLGHAADHGQRVTREQARRDRTDVGGARRAVRLRRPDHLGLRHRPARVRARPAAEKRFIKVL